MRKRDIRNSTFATGRLALGDRHIVEDDRTNAYQRAALHIAAVQRDAVAYRNFVFENRGILAGARVNYGIVLDVRAIADANVVHVPAQDCVPPHGRLFAEMHVTDNLRTLIDVCRVMDLRMDPAKWSNHISGNSSTA